MLHYYKYNFTDKGCHLSPCPWLQVVIRLKFSKEINPHWSNDTGGSVTKHSDDGDPTVQGADQGQRLLPFLRHFCRLLFSLKPLAL